MTKLIGITRSYGNNIKEFKAEFLLKNGKKKNVRFGTKSNYVLNPSKTQQDRINYLKRHRVNENWSDPLTPGALSRYILWGNSRNIEINIRDFKKLFNL
jgi:hypothetical protein